MKLNKNSRIGFITVYNSYMNRIIFLFTLLSFSTLTKAQNGLENIIVETYYISDSNDTSANSVGGALPIGSVTYRIYADLLPGYRFQAAYGVAGHELRIATTTSFFNNRYKGAVKANDIPHYELNNNTLMLDSWLSAGAGSYANYGILKEKDTTGTIINADSVLKNNNPQIGVPLTVADGLLRYSPQSVVTIFGLDSIANYCFGNENHKNNGMVFSTFDGSWASFGGAIGPDTSNKVLIAQITTDGKLSFELNIQIGVPGGGVQQYVARNPVEREIYMSSLVYPAPENKKQPSKRKPRR